MDQNEVLNTDLLLRKEKVKTDSYLQKPLRSKPRPTRQFVPKPEDTRMAAAYKRFLSVNTHCELAYGRLHKFLIACTTEQRAIVTVTMPEQWHKHQAWRPCFYLSSKGQCCCCLLGTLLSHLSERQMAFRNPICGFST